MSAVLVFVSGHKTFDDDDDDADDDDDDDDYYYCSLTVTAV